MSTARSNPPPPVIFVQCRADLQAAALGTLSRLGMPLLESRTGLVLVALAHRDAHWVMEMDFTSPAAALTVTSSLVPPPRSPGRAAARRLAVGLAPIVDGCEVLFDREMQSISVRSQLGDAHGLPEVADLAIVVLRQAALLARIGPVFTAVLAGRLAARQAAAILDGPAEWVDEASN